MREEWKSITPKGAIKAERERRIVQMKKQGLETAMIAKRLGVTTGYVAKAIREMRQRNEVEA